MNQVKNERFDRRFTAFGIGFPWVVAFCFAAVALLLRRGVPDPLGLHWNGHQADLTMSFPAFVFFASLLIGVIGSVCGALAGARLHRRWLRRGLMGSAVFLSLLLASLGAAWLMGQQDLGSADDGGFDSTVFALGAGAALALGVIMIFVYQPDPRWTVKDERALAAETAALTGAPRVQYWVHARSSNFVFLTMLVLLVGGLLLLVSPWISALLTVVVVVVALFLFARVRIDGGDAQDPRFTVFAAGFLKLIDLRLAELTSSEWQQIRVWLSGGPGFRSARNRKQLLIGDGFAILLGAGAQNRVLVSAPDREQAQELARYLAKRARLAGD